MKRAAESHTPFRMRYRAYITAAILAFVLMTFFHPVAVVGEAMEPTLHAGQVVVVTKHRFSPNRLPEIFAVVNFKRDFSDQGEPGSNKIRRIVGLPGDTVEIRAGVLYRNGRALALPAGNLPNTENWPATKLGKQEIYVLSDHAGSGWDSRRSGSFPLDAFRGTCRFIIWPLNEWGKI